VFECNNYQEAIACGNAVADEWVEN
jgi:hypothetical protein